MSRTEDFIKRLESHGNNSIFNSQLIRIKKCILDYSQLDELINLIEKKEDSEKIKNIILKYNDKNNIVDALYHLVHGIIPNNFQWFYDNIESYFNSL